MEMVIFVGAQASGKSSFFKQRFGDSHVRINLDMLRTRHRESIMIKASFEARQRFVVDNTNPNRQDRLRYFTLAKSFRFRAIGYYFQSSIQDCIDRNKGRAVAARVPERAIVSTIQKLEVPRLNEGFDELHFVRIVDDGFVVEDWRP